MFELKGKTVVVTGGGRGIGRGIVRAVATAGADVVLAGRTQETLTASAEEPRSLRVVAVPVVADMTSRDDLDRLV